MSSKRELRIALEKAERRIGRLTRDKNRYEAAQPSSPKRSYVPAYVRDARHDANSWSRWETCRKIRYFDRNVWLVKTNADVHVQWTVGPNGLLVTPASSDEEWNKRMEESYHGWCKRPFYDSSLTMAQGHKQMARCCHLEAEIFIHKTRIKLNGKPTTPAIQLIESHRCSSPGSVYSTREEEGRVDGVELSKDASDNLMGPKGYWLVDNQQGTQWAYRPIETLRHVFNPPRPGMYRDLSHYAPVMNTLHDLDDLELLAMERCKNNSQISHIFTGPSGEFSRADKRNRKYAGTVGQGGGPVPDSKDDDIDKRIQLYRKILGSAMVAVKSGETIQQMASQSPSTAEQWYWFYEISKVAKSVGVPFILLLPELIEGMQGTVVRSVLDAAHETFRGYFFNYAAAAADIYEYYANWARYNVPGLTDAPADWMRCHVSPPRAVNVDVGYTSDARLKDYQVGFTNFDDVGAQYGTTGEKLINKKAKGIFEVKKAAKEWSSKDPDIEITPEEISSIGNQMPQPEPDEDDKKDKAPTKSKKALVKK